MWAALVYEGYIYHTIFGFLISFVMGSLWWPGVSLGFIAGPVKEIIDFYDYGRFDEADMWMTWVGAMPGTVAAIMVYIAMKKRFKYRGY